MLEWMKLMMARENDDEGVEDDGGGDRRRVRFLFYVSPFLDVFFPPVQCGFF